MNRKIKFQEGGRTTPYNPMGHLTNPEKAEKRRVAGNKGRTPANKKGKYWWSEYTDPFTKPVDKFLSGALGPAAKPVQGLLDLTTPAKSINEVLNKPTAGNVINAATDTALTAAGLKAAGAPVKVAQKAAQKAPTPPVRKTVKATLPAGEKDMSKVSSIIDLFKAGKKAFKNTPEKIKANIKADRAAPSRKNPGKGKFTPSGAKPTPVTPKAKPTPVKPKAAATPKAKPTPVKPKAASKPVRPITDPTKQTNTNTGRAPDGGRGGATTPTPKPKATTTSPKTSPKTPSLFQRAKKVVKDNPGKTAAIAGATGTGLGYMLGSEKNATPASGSQAGGMSVNTSSNGSNAGTGAGMDTDLFDTPTGTTGRKPKKDPTEGGKYKSYSKDNNDFMYMTQKGYDEEEEQGDKAGGRPGRGKLKTQGMNKTGKRKAGFSGKGSGAALRGF